jgi:hypothetical protein
MFGKVLHYCMTRTNGTKKDNPSNFEAALNTETGRIMYCYNGEWLEVEGSRISNYPKEYIDGEVLFGFDEFMTGCASLGLFVYPGRVFITSGSTKYLPPKRKPA